jgi:hypothetical protein
VFSLARGWFFQPRGQSYGGSRQRSTPLRGRRGVRYHRDFKFGYVEGKSFARKRRGDGRFDEHGIKGTDFPRI